MKTETMQSLFLAGIALNAELIPAICNEREILTTLFGFKYLAIAVELFADMGGAIKPIFENAYIFLELYAKEKYPHLKEQLTVFSGNGADM